MKKWDFPLNFEFNGLPMGHRDHSGSKARMENIVEKTFFSFIFMQGSED